MFIEARIVCKVPRYLVQDLGLDMTQGQVVFYDHNQAKASKDLALAMSLNALEVTFVKTAKERRPAVDQFPPYVRRLGWSLAPPQEPPPPPQVDLDKELEQRFAKFEQNLAGQMFSMGQEVQRALIEELRGSLPQLQLSEEKVASMVEASVGKVLEAHKGTLADASPVEASGGYLEREPVYIPGDLTSSGGTAHINVKSTSSSDKTLDDAAAALKAIKKKTPRRRKKKTE